MNGESEPNLHSASSSDESRAAPAPIQDHGVTKLHEFEGRLYAQEHRTWHVWGNFWLSDFRKLPCKSKSGIRSAFLWWWISLIAPASGGGSSVMLTLIAVLSLFVGYCSMRSAQEQTALLATANQINQATQRAAAFSSRIDKIEAELLKIPEGGEIPERLHREIVLWSTVVVPYFSNDSDMELSPERGRILISLVDSAANSSRTIAEADFTRARLREARFQTANPNLMNAFLEQADLQGAVLSNAILVEAFLYDANLKRAILDGANLSDADLRKADLRGANLRGTILDGAIMDDVILDGAIVERGDWFEFLQARDMPPQNLKSSEWRITAGTQPDMFKIEKAN